MKKVLVLAPHADDAEFGLGGTMAKNHEDEYTVVIFACGHYIRSDGVYVTGMDREEEADKALKVLGVQTIAFAKVFGENFGDMEPTSNIVKAIDKHLDEEPYDEVYVCLPSFNQDHTALYDATITAFRPRGRDRKLPGTLLAYEYPGNSWGPPVPTTGHIYQALNVEQLAKKDKALKCHKTQFGRQGSTGHCTPEGAKVLATMRGSECGAEYAERFYLIRSIL